MSNIYVLEPPTNGRVVIVTDCGDLEIELWPKEAPKTCRNFIQLCMEGYYTNTIFHRIVKGFCIQAGDRTGTGDHQETVNNTPIPDEFHSRLRFVRRGLVASASKEPGKNGSQFFITLDKSEELNQKHTIFGKVVGDTFYNVIRIAERQVNAEDRPLYPPKIISIKIISNPFDDIVPRFNYDELEKSVKSTVQSQPTGPRHRKMLSFDDNADAEGNVEDNEESLIMKKKKGSIHDVIHNDKRIRAEPAVGVYPSLNRDTAPSSYPPTLSLPSSTSETPISVTKEHTPVHPIAVESPSLKQKTMPSDDAKSTKPSSSLLAEQRIGFGVGKKKGKSREEETMRLLSLFDEKLSAVRQKEELVSENKEFCTLHHLKDCSSCQDSFGRQDANTDQGWLEHTLKFAPSVRDAMTRTDNVEDLLVIDPRIQKVKEDMKKQDKRLREREPRNRSPERDSSFNKDHQENYPSKVQPRDGDDDDVESKDPDKERIDRKRGESPSRDQRREHRSSRREREHRSDEDRRSGRRKSRSKSPNDRRSSYK